MVFILGLPERDIAIARKHLDVEAVDILGWAGVLAVAPWIQAFIWAFRLTQVIDIRRFPPEEQRDIEDKLTSRGLPVRRRRREVELQP